MEVKKKKILIHSLVFSPDGVSTAYLYNDIALALKDAGYDVVVFTTNPHYNLIENELRNQPLSKRFLGLFYTSFFYDIRVFHIPQIKSSNSVLRILGFFYWHFISFFLILIEKNVSLILSPSPPLSVGLLNVLLGKVKKCKTIYNVQEIYPDILIENGKLKSKFIINVL